MSGKTTISKLIAKAYNLTYVNVDDILSEWESVSDQVGLLEKNPVYKKVFKRCRSGKGLSSAIIAEVITHVIGDSKSWVIDGGPRSLEQTKAFIENGLTPTFTINLKGDTKERVQNVKVFDSWVSESYINQKFYESINSNFNLETPNIIKTLEESSIKTIEIPIENEVNSNLSQVMETVDPFLSKAIPLSNAKITQLGDFEFGIVKDYCIVTLSKGLLVKGNSSQVAMYKVYLNNLELRLLLYK